MWVTAMWVAEARGSPEPRSHVVHGDGAPLLLLFRQGLTMQPRLPQTQNELGTSSFSGITKGGRQRVEAG